MAWIISAMQVEGRVEDLCNLIIASIFRLLSHIFWIRIALETDRSSLRQEVCISKVFRFGRDSACFTRIHCSPLVTTTRTHKGLTGLKEEDNR